MRTLVINLTRFGDLLQTQPVFTGLARTGDTVGLVCLENFAPATALAANLDAVMPVPGAGFLAGLDRAWPEALGGCLAWADGVRASFRPDRVINLTSSLPARLMATALAGGVPLQGFGLDAFGFGTYSTPWAAFLEATSRFRGSSPFNLVDIFFKAAHQGDAPRDSSLAAPSPEAVEAAREMISSSTGDPGHAGLVGMQLGASAEKRRWPVEHFSVLARKLWEEHRLLPVLLGSGDEAPLAARFAELSGVPHVNLAGRTDLPVLAGAVSLLKALVTNDTGTMHLAAGLGVPVVAFFLATAQPWDTGPYREDSCCLEPDMPCHPCSFNHECSIGWACRHKLSAEAAWTCLDGWLRTGTWPRAEGLGSRVWRSVQDQDGFMSLESLSGHDREQRTVWNLIQRQAWRRFLDGLPPDFDGVTAETLPDDFREELLTTLASASGMLEVLTTQAKVLTLAPRPALRDKFMSTWQRVESLLASERHLCALAHLWLHLSQAEGQDFSRFTAFASQVSDLVSALTSLLSRRQ